MAQGTVPSGITGVGATLRFLAFLSSCSDSLKPPLSLFPRIPPFIELVTLALDSGVIGGVESGMLPDWEFAAITLGTVPIVGVGELVDRPMVGVA